MDFTFLPKANFKNKTFARYTVGAYNAYQPKERTSYSHNGFYYIGKNADNIEKLVKVFKRGYASEILENAKFELKRSLEQEKNVIPEIIFCEGHFDFTAIKNFSQFLKNHPVLSSIPFVIDANGLSEKELNNYKKNKLPDEIIFLEDYNEKNLLAKGKFLKKIKSQVSKLEASHKMQMPSDTFTIQSIIKRAFDILISSVALLLVSPLFILIAVALKIESKGPVFYISKRAGRGYKIFNFYKFRTMYVGADKKIADFSHLNQYNTDLSAGPVFFKIDNDPRITKIGAFLRNNSLDELPQLLNVLLGDMSLVGNRPLPLYEAVTLTTDEWATRFMAPAGITGLWQIKKRGKSEMSVEERLNLDIDYANNCSFVYDLWIMANTPSALMQKVNA
jgi:lipopolysaccharide/colanic/teichoic acid biosynthesis glycosyltransferase